MPPPLPDEGGEIELYANRIGDDFHELFLQAINSAEHSIDLAIYSFNDRRLAEALQRRSEAGVVVRVVVDAKASAGIGERLGSRIHLFRHAGAGLMHLKVLVIDGRLTLLGSANFTQDSLRTQSNLVAAVPGKAFAGFASEKIRSLNESGGFSTALPQQAFMLGGQEAVLHFLPDDRQAAERLRRLLASAQHTIQVAMFTWTHEQLAHELIAAHNRGVSVEVILDHNSGKGTSAKVVELFRKHRVACLLAKPNALFHHKMVLVDGKQLAMGSANWTQAAFRQNQDCFLEVKGLSSRQDSKVQKMWQQAKREALPAF